MAFLSPRVMVDNLNIKPGSNIIDLGAGSGAYVYEAIRVNGKSGQVIAIDIDKEKLKMVKDTCFYGGYVIDTLLADLDKPLILPDYTADYIILANTLHLCDNKESLLKECNRILAPNGYMLFVEWCNHEGNSFKLGPSTDIIIKKEEAINMLREANFQVLKELPAGDFHYSFLINKLK